ncbi:Type II secretion system (T2SS), protein F [uncultured archaeon]|nr:Type II secretion system (T2SS), protein F [uncultured archaeon]
MGLLKSIYERVGSTINRYDVLGLRKTLRYAGIYENIEVWLGMRFMIALLFGIAVALVPLTLFRYFDILPFLNVSDGALAQGLPFVGAGVGAGLATFLIICLIFYMHLYYIIDDRRKRVEKVLPDFLLMVVANLRAGMAPFPAFRKASRPEFGPLEEEIELAAAKTMGTESLSLALAEISKGVNSPILKHTVEFFDSGVKSGGRLSNLLENLADEIRRMQELMAELRSGTRTYTVFLGFIVLIVLPLLLSISVQFVQLFSVIQSQQLGGGEALGITLFSGSIGITAEFMQNLAYLVLISSVLMITVLMGVISEGKYAYGLKYFVPLTIVALVAFTIAKGVIGGVLSAVA